MGDFGYVNYNGVGHFNIILEIVRLTGCNKYLELGVYNGLNVSKIHEICKYCVGVDIENNLKYNNFIFKHKTTDEFFSENKETFDIIFIDADHNFESVKKDFINSLKVLNIHGIIFLHDTDPISKEYIQPRFCGDSYKMIDWINENYDEFNTLTLPVTEAGLTIVNRKDDRRLNNYIDK